MKQAEQSPTTPSGDPEPGKRMIWIPVIGFVLAVAGAAFAVKIATGGKTKPTVSAGPDVPGAEPTTPPAAVLPELAPDESGSTPPDPAVTLPAEPPPAAKRTPGVVFKDYQRLASTMQYHAALPLDQQPRMIHWFGGIPSEIYQSAINPGPHSNIRRADYAGAESCKECHSKNYERWSKHPHRFMNAHANAENVVGDFSGKADMNYMGGRGSFYKVDSAYRMRLERDGVRREFNILRTIGSRFFQYYIGRLIDGPEPDDHPLREIDHVLPLGYWIEPGEWVPIVNVGAESPDEHRNDPFTNPSDIPYDLRCSACHTTRPVGDLLLTSGMMKRFDAYGPRVMHFATEKYLAEEHPELIAHLSSSPVLSLEQIGSTFTSSMKLKVADHAVNLGISCEGCHNGAAEHVRNKKELPAFFPRSPNLVMDGRDEDEVWGRNDININWVCSRCHAGGRARYANGISTWNSTELSDAARGACYNPVKAQSLGRGHLTCVHCHDPHTGIGKQWSRTPQQDNASCVSCHKQYAEPTAVQAHTHHAPASSGSECMNCHMPRLNEGLQDLVRTHTIFSPNEPKMLESNQPNACNMCHVDKTIRWTTKHLKEWYDTEEIPAETLAANYPDPDKAAVLNWLKSEHHGTRLVAADALTRQEARWGIGQVLDALDDPYLINRQFAARGLEKVTGVNPRDHGYRFYMFKKERSEPLRKLRKVLLESKASSPR